MRRAFVILFAALILTVLVAPVVSAGKFVTPQKADWFYVSGGSSNNVTTAQAYGHVQIVDPMGSATLIVTGVVQLAPSTGYAVWVRELYGYTGTLWTPGIGYYKLGWFMTDANGYADFNVKVFSNVLPEGTYNIQVAINADTGLDPTFIGTTVVATQWTAGVGMTVTVHS